MSVLKTSSKPLSLEKQPKPVLETTPTVATEQSISEKEKAEKEYYKVDADHPEQSPYVVKNAKAAQSTAGTAQKSPSLLMVEVILSEHLESLYETLAANKKEDFKRKGEEAATAIDALVCSFKAKAKAIINLIKEWLSVIPGINKFFLEQEAKIKTQKIMAYARQYKKENKK